MLYTNCEVIQIKFTIYFFYREKCSLEIMRFFFSNHVSKMLRMLIMKIDF